MLRHRLPKVWIGYKMSVVSRSLANFILMELQSIQFGILSYRRLVNDIDDVWGKRGVGKKG